MSAIAFFLGVMVGTAIILTAGSIIGHWEKKRAKPTHYDEIKDKASLRVYIGGYPVIGPITIWDLTQIIYYGGYRNQGEKSLIHLHGGRIPHENIDITVEYIDEVPDVIQNS